MKNSLCDILKGKVYPVLATLASCDHQLAKSKGYKNGWEMLIDKHDSNEMAMFCSGLHTVMTRDESTILLDCLAQEFTEFLNWGDFVDACCQHSSWKPSQGPAPKSRRVEIVSWNRRLARCQVPFVCRPV